MPKSECSCVSTILYGSTLKFEFYVTFMCHEIYIYTLCINTQFSHPKMSKPFFIPGQIRATDGNLLAAALGHPCLCPWLLPEPPPCSLRLLSLPPSGSFQAIPDPGPLPHGLPAALSGLKPSSRTKLCILPDDTAYCGDSKSDLSHALYLKVIFPAAL